MSEQKPRLRVVSKSEVLVLRRPNSRRHPFIYVRVSVGRGQFSVQSQERHCVFRKLKVDGTHDLKVVWVNDLLDDEYGNVKNCFVAITPESSYILQANTHRVKIEWMQALSIAISQSLRFRGSYRPSSWTNLDALQRWLNVRDVQYQYETDEHYKGAVYRGKWTMGMPHVCGSMKWTSGDSYDGEFRFGKFHGTGTMLWLSDRTKRSYTGEWQEGKMEGYGEMTYADHSVYTGWWHLGMRHGHGRMEYQFTGSSYSGAWEADMRSGYGVLSDVTKREQYLGMWVEDQYHGPGILIAENQFFFSGMFANGERSVSPDRTRLVQDEKWIPLFHTCRAMLEQMVSVSHSLPDITHPSFGDYSRGGAAGVEENGILQADSGLDVRGDDDIIQVFSPDMNKSCNECHARIGGTEECVVCRVEGFKSAEHPFGILVNHLTKCFNASYSGIGCHMNLLPYAIGELSSVTYRIHQLVRELCPSVISSNEDDLLGRPRSQLTLLLKHKHGDSQRLSMTSESLCDPTWLYPILLPSIFSTLFALYKVHYAEQDDRVADMMDSLGQENDEELCQLLGLDCEYKYWEEKYGLDGDVETTPDRTSFGQSFEEAVEIFQGISGYLTPLNKLLCIQEANAAVSQVWRSFRSPGSIGSESPLSPCSDASQTTSAALLSYVIVKSRVDNLFSEIQFTQDFAGKTLLTEEYGFLLSLLKDSYHQVDDLWSLRSETPALTNRVL